MKYKFYVESWCAVCFMLMMLRSKKLDFVGL